MLNLKKKILIGILGCGGVAHRWYLPGLSNSNKDYNLIAVADSNIKKAKFAAKKYNIPLYYNSLKDLIKDSKVNLLVILTRHDDHYNSIKFCLKKGINVYSEKPFVDSYKKGLELIRLAKRKKLYLGVAPQVMLSSRNIKMRKIVRSGALGKVTLIRASGSNMGPADRKGIAYDPKWFYKDGGSIKSLGIYTLSTLLWIFGKPKRVAGFSGISIPYRTVMYGPYKGKNFTVKVPDNEVAILEFDDNTFALFDGSYSVLNPPSYEFEIHGTKASLFVGGYGGKSSILIKKRNKEIREIGPEDNCHIKWNLSWGVENLVKAIIMNNKPLVDPNFALMVIQVIESIQKSSKSGVYINLNQI